MARRWRHARLAPAVLLSVVALSIALLGGVGSSGVADTPATVGFTMLRFSLCDIPLGQGWNLISLCANVTNRSVIDVFYGVDYRYVMLWNDTTQSFMIYSPRAASNPFTELEVNRSIFIYVNPSSAPASVGQFPTQSMNISVPGGWGTPSWPYDFGTNITKYFNATIHRYLMKWNQTAQTFMIYSPRAVSQPFLEINRTEGQFLYSYVPNTIVYNKTALGP